MFYEITAAREGGGEEGSGGIFGYIRGENFRARSISRKDWISSLNIEHWNVAIF